ncbi:hypothetical protein AB0F25_30615 [Streptomyces wedmorensis]|uniref:hypothetical protein n=1 Tax=Streptomyces wedmorensis TaxID=43759 RepID=UPI00342FE5C6
MSDLAERLRAHMADLVALPDAWDAGTAIMTAHLTPDGSVYLRDIGIPGEIWNTLGDDPVRMVEILPLALTQHSDIVKSKTDTGFFAWVMRHEAWLLERKGDNFNEAFKGDERSIRNRRLGEHPDRQEALVYYAACIDRSLVMALTKKSGDRELTADISRVNAFGIRNQPEMADTRMAEGLLASCEIMKKLVKVAQQ